MATRLRLAPIALGGVALVVGLGLALSTSASRASNFPALYVTFVVDHTFAVKTADGTLVGSTGAPGASIAAGTYQLYLNDASGAVMQFDLVGPGVSLFDNMTNGEDEAASYVETFLPSSTYTYRDDYRPGVVWAFATTATVLTNSGSTDTGATTSSGGTPSPTSTSGGNSSSATASNIVGSGIKADPFRGTLDAAVSASGKLAFTDKGKSVSTLRSGRYTIVATDKSVKDGFWLQESGKAAVPVTGTLFVGKRSVTADLKRGQWFIFATFVGKKTYFIVVS